jgi:2-oxoglutarate ferredoxin oxidoreductase subunit gamma
MKQEARGKKQEARGKRQEANRKSQEVSSDKRRAISRGRQEEIIISGFGGQGTLFAGQLLAHAVMDQGLHVTWIPSYGPEMRGGKARCTVIVSDAEIGSPLVRRPSMTIVLNIPSMDAFEPAVKPGGALVVNSSLVTRRSERDDIHTLYVPASDIATELGNIRLANVVCLGTLVQATSIVPLEAVAQALENHLPERHRSLLELNQEALRRGAELAQENKQ